MQCIGSNSGKRFPISRRIFPEQGVDKQCNDRICFFRKKFRFLSRGILFPPGTGFPGSDNSRQEFIIIPGFHDKIHRSLFQGRDSQFDIAKSSYQHDFRRIRTFTDTVQPEKSLSPALLPGSEIHIQQDNIHIVFPKQSRQQSRHRSTNHRLKFTRKNHPQCFKHRLIIVHYYNLSISHNKSKDIRILFSPNSHCLIFRQFDCILQLFLLILCLYKRKRIDLKCHSKKNGTKSLISNL